MSPPISALEAVFQAASDKVGFPIDQVSDQWQLLSQLQGATRTCDVITNLSGLWLLLGSELITHPLAVMILFGDSLACQTQPS